MLDVEKVIKGLEWCMNEKHDCYREKGCPYENEGEDIGCKYALHRDALALLKAQEPRLVTEDDFVNADKYGWLPAWCEERLSGDVYCECIPNAALEVNGVRYWTACPTDEQREATPWNVQR